jgi:hypothetical protein
MALPALRFGEMVDAMKTHRSLLNGVSLRYCIAAFLILTWANFSTAGEAYYVLVFGSQSTPPKPDYCHSFATFVRVTWPGSEACPADGSALLEAHTISWLPANLIVRTRALFPETGHNFNLRETLCYAYRNNERVSMWGPHEVEKDLYDRAMDQIQLLESGQVRYKADDIGHFSKRVCNCIHAVSSVAEGARLWIAEPGYGQTASFAITKRFRPWIIDKDQVHAWVGSAIGLDEYPIIYRDWTAPRSGGLIIGPIFRLLGADRNLQATYGPPR